MIAARAHQGRPSPATGQVLRRLSRLVMVVTLPAILAGCAAQIPQGTAGSLPFTERADSLFLSPVNSGQGGIFVMSRRLEKSHGQAEDYLRVWHSFLEEECRRRGLVLVRALRTDSLGVAGFRSGMDDEAWRLSYGVVPGPRSRVVHVAALRLESVRRNGFVRLLAGLNLMDDSRREFGWLDLDYEVLHMDRLESSGRRRLVSREPDTPWVTRRMDRGGRLMMKGARDLAALLDPRSRP